MQSIGKFNLKNQGGFVVKMGFQYHNQNSSNWTRTDKETGKILLGQSKTADPGDYGVADGDTVRIYADVQAGKDKHGNQDFTYQKGNALTAYYSISGTTLDDRLGLDEVK
jgi:hypothetical protein